MSDLEALLAAAAECEERGEPYALATLVAVRGSSYRRPGARLLVPAEGPPVGVISGGCLEDEAARLARAALERGVPALVTVDHSGEGDEVWGSGLGCRGIIDLFAEPAPLAVETVATLRAASEGAAPTVLLTAMSGERRRLSPDAASALGRRAATAVAGERPTLLEDSMLDPILPPPHLLVCGAGPDAEPLVTLALGLGWRVTVADPRRAMLRHERFGTAALCDGDPADAADAVSADARTAAVVMSHDYLRDAGYLAGLRGRGLHYLGILGPRDRTDRLLAELDDRGLGLTDADRAVLHAPAGLDLGADAAEEVALAVMAEILAAWRGRTGSPLSDRGGPIHTS